MEEQLSWLCICYAGGQLYLKMKDTEMKDYFSQWDRRIGGTSNVMLYGNHMMYIAGRCVFGHWRIQVTSIIAMHFAGIKGPELDLEDPDANQWAEDEIEK